MAGDVCADQEDGVLERRGHYNRDYSLENMYVATSRSGEIDMRWLVQRPSCFF